MYIHVPYTHRGIFILLMKRYSLRYWFHFAWLSGVKNLSQSVSSHYIFCMSIFAVVVILPNYPAGLKSLAVMDDTSLFVKFSLISSADVVKKIWSDLAFHRTSRFLIELISSNSKKSSLLLSASSF